MTVKKFQFEGIAKDGKILSGFLFSENKDTARAKLTEQGLAVLSLDPYIQQEIKTPGLSEFEFKGLGAKGEEIRGNIEAKTLYAAYKKLRTDYDFKLVYLLPQDLPYEQKEEMKKQGLDPQLEEIFQEDQQVQKKHVAKKSKGDEKQDKVQDMILDRKVQMEFFRKEIDFLIDSVQVILQNNEKFIDPSHRRDIQDGMNTLARLRQSNSTQHLDSIMRKIFLKLGDENIFLPIHESIPDFEKRKLDFQILAKTLQDRLDKGLAKINIGTLNSEAIKNTVKELHLFQKIGNTLYWSCTFLFGMLLSFWMLNVLKLFVGIGAEKASFYFTSNLFWFATGVTGIITLLLSVEMFRNQSFGWVKKSILYTVTSIILFLFVLEFPVIFYWF
ncbi:hypothetical protein K9L27_02875 [Candidatus Gracilibacteria bacterium]|nr:hypothetical protein [Candidatus Gracilibacteria bacterium]